MDYLQWQSDLSLEQIFASGESFTYPISYGDGFIYLTEFKSEKSRAGLLFKSDNESVLITPAPFSLRTRINEYGGKAFWLLGDQLYFCNQVDQCIYRQTLTIDNGQFSVTEPERITPKPTRTCLLMYTDIVALSATNLLVIAEKSNPDDYSTSNVHSIRCIDVTKPDSEPVVLELGADFYSNLVLDKQSKTIAWVQWNHPSMPWDETDVFTAKIIEQDEVLTINKHQVPLDDTASVCQLHFATNGQLFLSADFLLKRNSDAKGVSKDFWNIYCYQVEANLLIQVTELSLEFGYPHWQYGDCRIVQLNDSTLLTVGSTPTGDQLFLIDQNSLKVTELLKTKSTIQRLSSDGSGRALMVELPVNESARIVEYEDTKGFITVLESETELSKSTISVANHISFDCRDGEKAHGFYYPPCNANYLNSLDQLDQKSPPPLIVMVHGGPTARAYGHFDIQKQFWTSRGFALFDVNHRGSSGYGRNYRDALYDQWGEVDCSDVIDGIDMLIAQGKANGDQVLIRGKSAGGYAVLRALTQHSDVFKAGACYYGIGNLTTLAESTHKFEQHYTDRLIGESYDAKESGQPTSLFFQRSPIHDVDKLKSAMIVFQGSLDNVVPPEVAHEVIGVLEQSGIDHEYVEYPDEAHGFRQVKNNIDAWGKELAFYQRVLSN